MSQATTLVSAAGGTGGDLSDPEFTTLLIDAIDHGLAVEEYLAGPGYCSCSVGERHGGPFSALGEYLLHYTRGRVGPGTAVPPRRAALTGRLTQANLGAFSM